MPENDQSPEEISKKTMAEKLDNSASFQSAEPVEKLPPDPELEKRRQFYQDFTGWRDDKHAGPNHGTGFYRITQHSGQN